jgi:hypothetical protein
MMRTTIAIDAAILRELKLREALEGKTLGRVVSELRAAALDQPHPEVERDFSWKSEEMGALVELEHEEALRALDGTP